MTISIPSYDMTTLNISLPDSMRAFIEEQVKQKGYGTATEYIHHLIRQEQENVERKRLESLLLEGLDSGEPIEVSEDWWENKIF
ncbi:type II toxin-antitoxin system ParD family antitoxin [Scytonema sp. NUACC26]|uniref:type II toxin-antitoxin system ParD family antitoxin n=1 Tax=Scytonema sp. NUACC26 TaxID=3140176 RepID=UPI0038B2F342